ncbi:DNA polymerase-3 subunit epsilon [Ferrimonas sediminum]|uniref:DNA polymerase-3 subunit epsilon n=1 Tax=Ferrimonas sediminum TaxID=718193 RepID=A0A1G8N661_9GAMM|nr:3'-5' exonuclease [Ferrimonas sediminum]SDI75040.1 DNA polymerase-3 subunit epsilon [Ferrimonas sediminum]
MIRRLFGRTAEATPTQDWEARFAEQAKTARDGRLKHYFRAGLVPAATPLAEVPFVALDFETTGLDAENDSIISIGLVPFDLNRVYCRQACHWLVSPRSPLQEDSVVIHGITHSDLSDAPDLRRILHQVLDALAGKVVVVHYRNIEREFLDKALMTRLGEGIAFPMVDTLQIESDLQHSKRQWSWRRLLGREKNESVRLGSSRSRYGLPVYQPHHALTDAIATAELFQAQVAHHFSPDLPIGQLWR